MDYKESDKIVTILTREYGKVRFVAKGVKKVKSKHGASCQLFTHGDFSYYLTKGLGTLRHAELVHSFYEIRANLDLASYAAYLNEIIEIMSENEHPEAWIYDSYLAALYALEKGTSAKVILHIFELALLRVLGYSPQWNGCVHCQQNKGPFVVSAKAGGVVCDVCMHYDETAITISETNRRLLHTMQNMTISQLGVIELSEQTLADIKRIIRYFIDYHIEYPWKSRRFLDQWHANLS
jgi:DNA repair protein RecO (recombination protein O)